MFNLCLCFVTSGWGKSPQSKRTFLKLAKFLKAKVGKLYALFLVELFNSTRERFMNRNHSQNKLHNPNQDFDNYRSDGPGPVEIEAVNNENFDQSFRGKGPKGYIRSDERIEEEVCKNLARDKHIDASSIDVGVENGIVKLTGLVHSRQEKFAIEDAVENVSGVKEVKNDIKVQKKYDVISYEF
jgi:hypothetical protein